MRFKIMNPVLFLCCIIFVSGCAIKPKPFTGMEAKESAANLKSRVHLQQTPLSEVMSLDEAIARTLKYNLEHRLKMFEVSLKQKQYDLSMFDLLPEVTARGETEHRNNDDASVSKNLRTGTVSSDYTTSEDRNKRTGNISLTWNILDLGISYYTVHQQANRFLIAKEQQRKVVQDIIGETRDAFFKVLIAQELDTDITQTLTQAGEALTLAQDIETQRLRPMEEILIYQKSLIQLIKQLEDLRRELAMARVELAALMNLPSTSLPKLQAPAWYGAMRDINVEQSRLEDYAFSHRPEIFQWGYQKRITALEAKKAIFDLVPGVGLNLSADYSSNSYDLNSVWQQASVHVAYNLMNLAKYPAKKKMFAVQEEVDDAQGLAMGMAVLAQVNLATQQHQFATQTFARASQLSGVEQRLKELSTKQVQQRQGIRLDSIQKSVAAIAGRMNREQALIGYYKSLGNIYTAIGVDYLDYSALPADLGALTETIAAANKILWTPGDLNALLEQPAPTTQPAEMN